ncbi:MAG TPA: ABC transporter permease [Aggregatilineales bacterium]|nr:ABC transporter permease [Chloroflexota bacterium]HOA23936.1 ABC transporter permease [Aggregatilineales bacterium]HQA67418.1 ABC transporter permease [Aggregatilineales bacterium]HQE18053.1 ABC transporter permease [Aggregatilineales bacterium]
MQRPNTMPAARGRAREGSPWTGMWAVVAKDMADHLSSARMLILELLILATAVGTVYVALQNLRQSPGNDPFIFLRLFTTAQEPLPAFVGFLSFLVPLVAITLAFDAVNGEFSQRTLSRVLSQPIYRDALLAGKFLAGLFTLALVLAAIWLLIIGLGILGLGVPPSGEEVARLLLFLLVSIFYGGVWLALALLFSIVFRQSATAALASIAVWLFFMVFWSILAGLLARAIMPVDSPTVQAVLDQVALTQALERISPNTLFVEATIGLLYPSTRSFGLVLPVQLQRAVLGAPLPLGESVMLIWPHLTGLIAATIVLFAVAYVLFQRQEIRA